MLCTSINQVGVNLNIYKIYYNDVVFFQMNQETKTFPIVLEQVIVD